MSIRDERDESTFLPPLLATQLASCWIKALPMGQTLSPKAGSFLFSLPCEKQLRETRESCKP